MGIKDVKARLPFTLEDMFKLDRVVIDAANLMFLAMLKQAKAGFTEDLDPALNEFQYMLNQATGNFSEIKLIFDGLRWEQKVHEHFRRQRARELALEKVHAAVAAGLPPGPNDLQGVVQNTARFSLLCIKLCKAAWVPFVVAPFEADPPAARRRGLADRVLRHGHASPRWPRNVLGMPGAMRLELWHGARIPHGPDGARVREVPARGAAR